VRDWQHFDDDEDSENEDEKENYAAMEASMKDYLEKVTAEREAKDLKDTREQINSCFEEISCFGLCHPGFAATKKKFKGSSKDVEPLFLHLLDRFCQRVFDEVAPKKIHGRDLTAPELMAYVAAYAKLFASGATFPEAATLLEATSSTNNTNAVNMALSAYQREMDRVAGPHCSSYVRPAELEEESKRIEKKSFEVFSSIANFGSKKDIEHARATLMDKIGGQFEMYNSLNDGRDPLAGMEMYVLLSLCYLQCLEPTSLTTDWFFPFIGT
jgi:atlastin